MQHSYPSTHGSARPSARRLSPTNLDSTEFSAGVGQTQDWQYDPTRNLTTTATQNGQYTSTIQAGYSYLPQAAQPSYTQTAEYANYAQPVVSSSRYQNYNAYPNNTQSCQQTGVSHHSAPAEWLPSSYYDPSVQPLVSYSSTHQHATAASSSSSSQRTPHAKSASSNTQSPDSKPTASTSRPRKGIIPDMKSKMNRFRVANMTSTIPVESPLTYQPQPPVVGEKRKERSPTPDAVRAEAPLKKDTKRREAQRIKSQKSRDQLHSDIAELAERLPSHLRAPGDMSSRNNIIKAATYIDQQNAHIGRLENDIAQYSVVQSQLASEVFVLRGTNYELMEINEVQQRSLAEKDKRIRQLEGRQTLQ